VNLGIGPPKAFEVGLIVYLELGFEDGYFIGKNVIDDFGADSFQRLRTRRFFLSWSILL
jgi:hypothetical protein